MDLFVCNAGTAARFLAAFVCLGKGPYRLHGVPRMHQRPQSSLFRALRDLGYHIETSAGHDRLPATIHGHGPRQGRCQVSIVESSQFASALMLCAQAGGWEIEVVGENAEESPYVAMTSELIKQFRGKSAFPDGDRSIQIEPDASSGSYFWAAHFIRCPAEITPAEWKICSQPVLDWPASGWQIDASFPRYWPLPAEISREGELADSIMSAMMLAPFARSAVRFTHLSRLRVQESERVSAVRTELSKCGATVLEEGDSLTIHPGHLHGAEIETYDDHRIAMCFSILGLKVPGIKIKNPACVKKTFPNFFQKLAAAPPHGLGVDIRAIPAAGRLEADALFAN